MSFFLLGQGRDSLDLRLISDQVFTSKQDAMSELSSLTADPEFPHWDVDVLVMDLEAGTPVLLVKPKIAVVPITPEPEVEPEQDQDIEDVANEPFEAEEDLAEAISDADESAGADVDESAGVWESPGPEPSLADDLVTFDDSDESPQDSLAQAIKRATGALESEGIVAPESIGPTETSEMEPTFQESEAQSVEVDVAPAAWPWAVGPENSPEESSADEAPEPVDDVSAAPEKVQEAEIPPLAESDVTPYVPDPFEEPAIDVDDAGMVSMTSEIPESDANGPVILGEYGASAIAGDLVVDDEPSLPMSESSTSDIQPDAPVMDLETSTCDECVYAGTCPNKGELDPKSCGSFQWK